jgi:cell division protein FtsB
MAAVDVLLFTMPPAADVPPRPPSSRAASTRSATPAATPRRQPAPAKAKSGAVRRLVRPALALITLVLVADALVGENGWFERNREQQRLEQKSSELARLQRQNAELAVRAKRLEAADPTVIEDLARRKLEMLKPGEVLFIAGSPAVATSSTTPALPH